MSLGVSSNMSLVDTENMGATGEEFGSATSPSNSMRGMPTAREALQTPSWKAQAAAKNDMIMMSKRTVVRSGIMCWFNLRCFFLSQLVNSEESVSFVN